MPTMAPNTLPDGSEVLSLAMVLSYKAPSTEHHIFGQCLLMEASRALVRKLFTSSSDDQRSPLHCGLQQLRQARGLSQAREGKHKTAESKFSCKPGTRIAKKFTAEKGCWE